MYRAVLLSIFWLLAATSVLASDYERVTPDRLKEWLQQGSKVFIVDLQPKDEFQERHFKGSVWVGPHPDKNRKSSARLEQFKKKAIRLRGKVVIVSCDGGDDALRAAIHLSRRGIDRKRIIILAGV
jgi:rhodanese-related sulfurtransferase